MTIFSQTLCASRLNKSRPRPLRATAVALVAAMLASTGGLHAASDTYTGTAGDNIFDNGANWASGTAPGDITAGDTTNADVATFNLLTGAVITLNAQRNLGGITFAAPTGTPTAFTIGATTGPALLLSSGGSIIASTSAAASVVAAPLFLQNAAGGTNGVYTFESDVPGTSRTLNITGAVTGNATSGTTFLTLTGTSGSPVNGIGGAITDGSNGGFLGIIKNGTNTWQFTGANAFSGGVTLNGGTLRTNLSAAGNLTFGIGTVTFAGTGGTLAFAATVATTINNNIVVNGPSNFITTRGSDTLVPASMTGTGTLTLASNSGTATISYTNLQGFAGTIEVATATVLRATAAASNTALTNTNIVIDAGGALTENIGTNTAAGAAVMIGSLASGTTTTGGTIGGSAAGTGFFNYTVNGNNASTTYAGTIIQGGTGTALTKAGTGILTLAGVNTYASGTTVSAGTLTIAVNGALGTGNVTVAPGATLTLNAGVTAAHNNSTATTLTLTDAATSIVNLLGPAGTVQDTVANLIIAGVTQPTGTYGAAGSGAMFILADFMGLGELLVGGAAVPEPSTWVMMVGGLGGLIVFAVRRNRCA